MTLSSAMILTDMEIRGLILEMIKIVDDKMMSFQSDFYRHDLPYIASNFPEKCPMIWIVSRSHTFLLKVGEYETFFEEQESTRYDAAQGRLPFGGYIDMTDEEKELMFMVDEKGLVPINRQQAKNIVRDITTPVIHKWVEKNGPLPSDFKIPVKIRNISLGKLKDLMKGSENRNGQSLLKALKDFRHYQRTADNEYIDVCYEPACNEFSFGLYKNDKCGLHGGIVFHGWPETGYEENFAVQLEPAYGWRKHT